ncbi:tetratricopeptide repeat protein [Amycolatopsis sp. WGS_07]|uniref:tetratricopeptide repeat protein n=1 Tax=Amycolatopsis sp. WGS_07 TaxID=3076764 RepID=UPI003873AFF7
MHLSFTLYRYFDNGGHFQDALTLYTAIRDAADPDSVDRSYALCARTHTLVRLGRYDEAIHDADEALRNSPEDFLVKYSGCTDLGIIHEYRGEHDQAVACYLDAIAASQAAGHRVNLGNALNNLGDLYRELGRYAEADDHLRRSLAIAEEAGATGLAATALTGLGELEQAQGHHHDARTYYARALDLVRTWGNRSVEAELLNCLAAAAPDRRESLAQHQEALRLARDTHSALEQARAHDALARLHHGLGELVLSRRHATCALRLYTALKSPHADAVEEFIASALDHTVRIGGAPASRRSGGP